MADITTDTQIEEEPAAPTAGRRALISITVMLATIMQTLDSTIANVALPSMQGEMSATQDQIAWVLTSYIIAAAIMTPPTGYLAARFGRKRMFVIAVSGFIITSMLCGAATSVEQVVLFRLLQGMSGAALIPLSQAVMLDTYPREKLGQAMAMFGMGVMLGPIIGPTLGGYLTETISWRWVFYINLPIGLVALAGIMLFVPGTEKDKERQFDWRGFSYLSLGIGALQLMSDRGESQDWFSSPEIVMEALLGGIMLYMFVIHMLSAKNTFISRALFKDRNFVLGLVVTFMISINMLATMALLPPFLQNLGGYSVIDTGIVMAPRGFGTMFGMMLVGRMIGRVDERLLIATGLILSAVALVMMTGFTADVSMTDITVSGLIQGLGFGLVFVPLTTISFSTLGLDLRVEASAIYALARNVGSSIGISIIIRELATTTQSAHSVLTEHLTPYSAPLGALADKFAAQPGDPFMLSILDGMVYREAYLLAFIHDFWFMIAVTLATVPLVLIIRPGNMDELDQPS